MQSDDEGYDFPSETMISCPYCGEEISVGIDPTAGSVQSYVEDCEVCCQPWMVTVRFGPDGTVVAQALTIDE